MKGLTFVSLMPHQVRLTSNYDDYVALKGIQSRMKRFAALHCILIGYVSDAVPKKNGYSGVCQLRCHLCNHIPNMYSFFLHRTFKTFLCFKTIDILHCPGVCCVSKLHSCDRCEGDVSVEVSVSRDQYATLNS